MNGPTTDPLTREQRARAEALHTAAAVLTAAPAIRTPLASDVVEVAVYVETGAAVADARTGDLVEVATLSGEPTGADQ